MKRRGVLVAGAGVLTPALAIAQALPSRPLRIVIPFGPGGIADLTARAVANKLSDQLKQAVIIDNKPGAGGVVAGDLVAKAAADGHTLLLMSNATAVSAGLFASLPFDALKDFSPVGIIGTFDIALVTQAGSRFKTIKDFLAAARANPGKLNVGTINVGSTQHLSAELVKSRAGVDWQVVPFNGSPAVLTALRGGQIDAAVEILGPMLAQISAGAVHPLAVLGARRSPALSQVPTLAESGLAAFNVTSWNALAAPAATPQPVVALLNRELNRALADPLVRRQLADLNVTPKAGTPEQLRELLSSEIRRWSEVIALAKVPKQ